MRKGRFAMMLMILMWSVSTTCRSQQFPSARIVGAPKATAVEIQSLHLLAEEAGARTGFEWQIAETFGPTHSNRPELTVVAALSGQVSSLLPPTLRRAWIQASSSAAVKMPEGFTVRSLNDGKTQVIVVAGNDSRGLLYGVGYLLRKLSFGPGYVALPGPLNLSTAPEYPVRSHQIGYRFKNNTYDGWTLSMFEQHIRDLAVFGISGLQVIAPHSDDAAASPLFPAPALETIVGISRLLGKYGLDFDLYYPEMRHDYHQSADVQAELKDFEDLIRVLPNVHALFVPGGDPGHTEPKDLLALLEKESVILHRYHPHAEVWVSAQGFDRAWYEEFYALLQAQPTWLTGVFFGPQSRDSFETQRSRIPSRYKLLFYPDIGHTMHAQFPVPEWDPIYALTEGREPIDPRPLDETHIYRHFARLHSGFVTYSEGVNDDVNKFLWTRLGWSANTDPHETLRDYSRYFLGAKIGDQSSDSFAEGVFDLEQNWRGPLDENAGISKTLQLFQSLENVATPQQKNNWRFESALYRAYYDAYLQTRLNAQTQQEEAAMKALAAAPVSGSANAIHAATATLEPKPSTTEQDLRGHVFDLAGRLFQHVKLQLSVSRYGASNVERGANLDHIDLPLNDRAWLEKRFAEITQLPSEESRLAALNTIVHWSNPAPGSLYDDLGNPQQEPNLVRGAGFDSDPELYRTAIDGIADRTTLDGWRLSWLDYAETLYEVPLELRYTGLNPQAHYTLRVTYAGEDYTLPLTLTANDTYTVHAARQRHSNPETVDFDLPAEVTKSGMLDLKWQRPDGLGGSGRGRQVAEVWLIPQ